MPSADQVAVNNSHSSMQWPKWVVLIAGSTGSVHHAMVRGAISSDPQRGWIIISLAPSHHCPGHSGKLVRKRDSGDFVGRRVSNAATHGRYLVPWILA